MNEFGRTRIVRQDAADLGNSKADDHGPCGGRECPDARLIRQVQLPAAAQKQIHTGFTLQPAHPNGTDLYAMASDYDHGYMTHSK